MIANSRTAIRVEVFLGGADKDAHGFRVRSAILAERGAQLIERRNQRRSVVVRTHLRKDCVEESDMLHHRRKLSGLHAAMAGIAVSGNNRLELLGEIAADQVPNDEQIGHANAIPKLGG